MARKRFEDDDEFPSQTKPGLTGLQIFLYCVLDVVVLGCTGLTASAFMYFASKPTEKAQQLAPTTTEKVQPKPPVVEQPKFKEFEKMPELKPAPVAPPPPKPVELFPYKLAKSRIEAKKESITDIISDYTGKEWLLTIQVIGFGPNGEAECYWQGSPTTVLKLPKGTKVGDKLNVVAEFYDYNEFNQNAWFFRFRRVQ